MFKHIQKTSDYEVLEIATIPTRKQVFFSMHLAPYSQLMKPKQYCNNKQFTDNFTVHVVCFYIDVEIFH